MNIENLENIIINSEYFKSFIREMYGEQVTILKCEINSFEGENEIVIAEVFVKLLLASDYFEEFVLQIAFDEFKGNYNISNINSIEKNDENVTDSITKIKKFDIDYWSYNITYQQIADIDSDGDFIKPEMQRNFVWDDLQASKLIESIIMGLPLPSIFLVKSGSKYIIVDGLQRITTISCFLNNKPLPNRKNLIKLIGVNDDLFGRTLVSLKDNDQEYYKKIIRSTINVIEFKQNKPDNNEAMYYLFERLNSGGTTLSPQQIRNSISYGEFNKRINCLAEDKLSMYFSIKEKNAMLHSECILRVIAIFDLLKKNKKNNTPILDIENSNSINYKIYLNEIANLYHTEAIVNDYNYSTSKYNSLFKKIETCINLVEDIFETNSFKRYIDGKYKKSVSPIIIESEIVFLLINFSKLEKLESMDKRQIKARYEKLIQIDYPKFFTTQTGRYSNIFERINTFHKIYFGE